MKNMPRQKLSLMIVVSVLMLFGYNNCGGGGEMRFNESASLNGSTVACEQELKAVFARSYRPLLTSSSLCLSCHTEGGSSPYKFASSNLDTAFETFRSLGADTIDARATSSTHAGPITGPQNATSFAAAHATWNQGLGDYQSCLASSAGTDSTPVPLPSSDVLMMTERNEPNLYFGDGRVVRLSWNLSSEALPVTARFQATFSVDARVVYATVSGQQVATGYAFRNPSLAMQIGETEVEVEGVVIHINGVQPPGTEPFLSARATARGIDPTVIYNGEVIAPMSSISSADKISISFGYFDVRLRTDNPPRPPTPTLAVTSPFARTTTVNVTISNNGTARRYCLTANPTPVTSANDKCPGYAEGSTLNAWVTARPGSVDMLTLGRTPNENETVTLYLWVVNSDLKVNASPATATVTFDSLAPAPVTFTGVTLGATQIATLSGVGDASEQVNYCVNISTSSGAPNNCNGGYSATKPTLVGLPNNGLNYISIFVRDRAGNTSTASAVRSVNNTHGRITYTQLTTAVDARGVFQARCFSCHASGMANSGNWNASDYSVTIGRENAIKSRINSSTNPMPPTGMLSESERRLIYLWFDQTGTPLQ